MKKIKNIILFVFISTLITSCISNDSSSGGITEINIPEALKNSKDFKLSDLVKDVELLELEGSPDYYIEQALIPYFGEKFILVMDYNSMRIFLFRRNGSFVREIGKKGNGPGEHHHYIDCDMDPTETHIVIADFKVAKVMVFNVDGTLEVEKNLSNHFANPFVQKISWDLEGVISFLPNRPYQQMDGFASVVLFDSELNFVANVLPRKNNDSLDLYNISYYEAFGKDKQAYFWECFYDTIYRYDAIGNAEAVYRIEIGDNKLTDDVLKNQDFQKIYQYDQPMYAGFLGDFLYFTILVGGEEYSSRMDVFFDMKKNEGFTIDHQLPCGKNQTQSHNESRNIENDLFGLEQVSLFMYSSQQNLCVHPVNVDLISHFSDINCIKNLDVKYPEIRDRLVRIIEEPKEEDGKFIVVMHLF